MEIVEKSIFTMLFCAAIFHPANAEPDSSTRLSTEQIKLAFTNMRDTAEVQDSKSTTAVNLWFEDGTFINNWTNSSASGTVTGHWYAENGLRCVIINTGLPEANGTKKCGPIYQRGEDYFSINKDGSIHGIHRLSSMTASDLNKK